MPWCEECSKYLTPSSMSADGSCPKCGAVIEEPSDGTESETTPWHFKLLVVALIAYLSWRIIAIFV